MTRRLDRLGRTWEGLARRDPLNAICSDPARSGRRWDLDEFYATGRTEILVVLHHLKGLGLEPDPGGEALDFGCGVGRLTQAMAPHVRRCWGVDISPTMIELAQQHNAHGDRCAYVVNQSERLPMFQDGQLAFVYTSIVLQHMRPELAGGYLREFSRILRPGGILVFQMPDRNRTSMLQRVRRRLGIRSALRDLMAKAGLAEAAFRSEMNCIPEARIRGMLQGLSLNLLDVQLTNSAENDFNGHLRFLVREPLSGIISKQYCAVKGPASPPAR